MTCEEVTKKLGGNCFYFQNHGNLKVSACKLNENGECNNILAKNDAKEKKEK